MRQLNAVQLTISASIVVVSVLILGSGSLLSIESAAGDPDPGFGSNGVARFSFPRPLFEARLVDQADGSIRFAGLSSEWAANTYPQTVTLGRLKPDGAPDLSFGQAGIARVPLSGMEFPGALAFSDDGTVLVVQPGQSVPFTRTDMLVVRRIGPDGQLDRSFGGGRVELPSTLVSGHDHLQARLLSGGRIFLAMAAIAFEDRPIFGPSASRRVLRTLVFRPDGSRDLSNGVNGILEVPLDAFGITGLRGYLIGPDSSLLAFGSVAYTTEDTDLAIARFRPDGSRDETFGTDGQVVLDLERGRDSVAALALQSDGAMVAVVESVTIDRRRPTIRYVMRFLGNGSVDPLFGDGGRVTITHPFGQYSVPDPVRLTVADDGAILLLDNVRLSGCFAAETALLAARWDRNGRPDPTYGRTGTANVWLPLVSFQIQDATFDRQGRPLVIGGGAPGSTLPAPTEYWTFLVRGLASGEGLPQLAPFRVFLPTNKTCVPYQSPYRPNTCPTGSRPVLTTTAGTP